MTDAQKWLIITMLVRRLQVLTNQDRVTFTDQDLVEVERGWRLEAWYHPTWHQYVIRARAPAVTVDAQLPADPVLEEQAQRFAALSPAERDAVDRLENPERWVTLDDELRGL